MMLTSWCYLSIQLEYTAILFLQLQKAQQVHDNHVFFSGVSVVHEGDN